MYAGRSNYYFLNIDADTILDAGRKGSEARFANHCCNPVPLLVSFVLNIRMRGSKSGWSKGSLELGSLQESAESKLETRLHMVRFPKPKADVDYNFSWFENAKEQKCMCGAENCRGFIGKRKALPPPPKPPALNSPKKGKAKTGKPKVKRVVEGRITKVSQKKVKAQLKNGKVVKATIVTARTKVKATRKTKVQTKVKKAKTAIVSKKTTMSTLGKRKRTNSVVKSAKSKTVSPKKGTMAARKIAKPRSTKTLAVESPTKSPNRPVYDSVSHRKKKGH